MTGTKHYVLGAALGLMALAAALPARADTVSFSAGNYYQDKILNIGQIQGSNFDTLSLIGQSGSFVISPGQTVDLAISSVTFTEGPSCQHLACPSQDGNATFSMTLNGVTNSIVVPWTACIGGGPCNRHVNNDSITLFASSPVSF